MTVREEGPIAAITGANGYVGSLVADCLSSKGFHIRRLVRRPEPGTSDQSYDIVDGCSPEALREVDVLVHCAYDFTATSEPTSGTATSTALGASSTSRSPTPSDGRSSSRPCRPMPAPGRSMGGQSWPRRLTHSPGGMCAIRPGLIYGPGWGGMVGTLRKLTALPLVPLVGGHSYQFTLHEDDLRAAVATLASAADVPTRPLGLANPRSRSLQGASPGHRRGRSRAESALSSAPVVTAVLGHTSRRSSFGQPPYPGGLAARPGPTGAFSPESQRHGSARHTVPPLHSLARPRSSDVDEDPIRVARGSAGRKVFSGPGRTSHSSLTLGCREEYDRKKQAGGHTMVRPWKRHP